jgi:hypothetical protein
LAAQEIWRKDRQNFHERVVAELLAPNLDRINKALSQANDSRYLAYVIEHVFMQSLK